MSLSPNSKKISYRRFSSKLILYSANLSKKRKTSSKATRAAYLRRRVAQRKARRRKSSSKAPSWPKKKLEEVATKCENRQPVENYQPTSSSESPAASVSRRAVEGELRKQENVMVAMSWPCISYIWRVLSKPIREEANIMGKVTNSEKTVWRIRRKAITEAITRLATNAVSASMSICLEKPSEELVTN